MITDDVATTDIVTAQQMNLVIYEMMPLGSVSLFGSDTLPDNWLLCNGQAVSRATYSTLFTLIGTTFGSGDGSSTFNLPDMRDKFARSISGSIAVGSTGGGSITLNSSTMPAHTHSITAGGSHSHADYHSDSYNTFDSDYNYPRYVSTKIGTSISSTSNTHSHGGATGSKGSGNSIPVVVAYQVFNFMIKAY